MGIFLLFYKIFIKKKGNFVYNRYYLLFSVVVSSLIPLIQLPENPFAYKIANVSGIASIQLNEFIVQQNNVHSFLPLETIIFSIYAMGALFFLFRIIWSFIRLYQLHSRYEKQRSQNETIIFIPESDNVFSFFKWIFIPKSLYQNTNGPVIIQHERIHAQQNHSMDLIIAELIRAFQWFNPLLYLCIKEIKENHEYLADEGMKKSNQAYEFYKALLFQQTTGIEVNPIANLFSYSLLKKRMKMMKKQKKQNRVWILGWTLLAVLLAFTACNQPTSNTKKKQVTEQNLPPTADSKVFTVVEQKPEFVGGNKALIQYLAKNIKYPKQAKKKGIQGRVFVSFIIEKDGSVSHAKILKGIGGGCDKEALKVVEQMPKWIPGKQSGENVRVAFTLPINFKLK